jgi:4-amino-4-deoxy-L-arabinose transferase-like glycosyltransferase
MLFRLLNSDRFVPICFVAYMAARTAIVFVHPLAQSSDALWYYDRASAIISGRGYSEEGVPTAFWPVGWPAVLAGAFMVTGPSALAGQFVNLLFSALVFVLTMTTGARLFGDRLVGRGAVLLLSFYPNQIAYVPFLLVEIFYAFLLLLSVWLLKWETRSTALASGLVFGLATLTKTQSWFLPAIILLGVFLAAPSRRTAARYATLGVIAYVAMVLVIAPWTYRNYRVFDAFVPVATNGGWTLLTGNNSEADGGYSPNTELAVGINHDPADQVAMDRLARARAQAWIQDNPVQFLFLLPRKLLKLWVSDDVAEWAYKNGMPDYQRYEPLFRAIRYLNQAYYFLLLLAALPPVWSVLTRRVKFPPWGTAGVWMCVYATIISLVFSGQSRFHFSLMPFVSMYSAWTLVRWAATNAPQAEPDLDQRTFIEDGQKMRSGSPRPREAL